MSSAQSTPEPLSRFLGRQFRAARGDRRQDDIAVRLGELGLPWDRSAVASLETGRRAPLRLDELLIVLAAYETSLTDLLAGEAELDESSRHRVSVVRQEWPPIALFWLTAGRLPEDGEGTFQKFALQEPTEAERRVAKQLEVEPGVLHATAKLLWGRSLDDERDHRLNLRAAHSGRAQHVTGPGTLAASGGGSRGERGHVTRQLIEELRLELKGMTE